MSWNYRLFRQETPKSADNKGLCFVGECYYDKDGKPEMHSLMDFNVICGDTPRETKEVYKMVGEAFDMPVIELDINGDFK